MTPIILTLGESHFLDTLQYLIGFVFVMGVLILLWILTLGIGKISQRASGLRSTATPTPLPSAEGFPDPGPGIRPEAIAVIAAAIHCSLDTPVRVVSIKPSSTDWSAEGRRQIFASRRVR